MNKVRYILWIIAIWPALACAQSADVPLPDIDIPPEEMSTSKSQKSASTEEPPDLFLSAKPLPSVSVEPPDVKTEEPVKPEKDIKPEEEGTEKLEEEEISLPVLKDIPVSVIPSDVLLDAFGLPVNPPPIVSKDAKKAGSGPQQVGWQIGKIVTRLAIQGVWPGREVIIDTVPIPLGGTFVVNVKENEKTFFHVKRITDTHVIFGWAKDDATYVYPLPAPQPSAVDMDSVRR